MHLFSNSVAKLLFHQKLRLISRNQLRDTQIFIVCRKFSEIMLVSIEERRVVCENGESEGMRRRLTRILPDSHSLYTRSVEY